jgi:hypothetical protein
MLIAIVLFIFGMCIAYSLQAKHVVVSSIFIFAFSVTIFSLTRGMGAEQILITFAYLSAHQSGYLVGSYLNGFDKMD